MAERRNCNSIGRETTASFRQALLLPSLILPHSFLHALHLPSSILQHSFLQAGSASAIVDSPTQLSSCSTSAIVNSSAQLSSGWLETYRKDVERMNICFVVLGAEECETCKKHSEYRDDRGTAETRGYELCQNHSEHVRRRGEARAAYKWM
ncbi:hypothetical protein RRG08_048881 [Elysia crispata]|uniref:Uncharacterized protein n=1 Tax=Elysia crispata TaxID=231223 RepID=A0AAE0YTU3_9GAST|nr:hypothetical protein RRG08_048881 [Elysia crispata]